MTAPELDTARLTPIEKDHLWATWKRTGNLSSDDAPFWSEVDKILADRLAAAEQWKAEALPVMAGLQDLGRALDLPLGASITGPQAAEAATALREGKAAAERERDALAEVVRDAALETYLPEGAEIVVQTLIQRAQQVRDAEAGKAAAERAHADLVAAVEAVLSEPDDTQWWPVEPYLDPPNDDEVVETQVIAADRLRAVLAVHTSAHDDGGEGRG
jgi:hypothetical protein